MARFRWLNACTLCTLTITGIWSQIKRAPASNKKRKTYEVDGPARPNAMPLDQRARQVFSYFKKYNYEVKGTGEVITFVGLYAADKGQAAAVTFYTFCGAWTPSLCQAKPQPQPSLCQAPGPAVSCHQLPWGCFSALST